MLQNEKGFFSLFQKGGCELTCFVYVNLLLYQMAGITTSFQVTMHEAMNKKNSSET
jgi:hypothetical protein